MIYGISGTRRLTPSGRRTIEQALAALDPASDEVVVGGCVGADAVAGAEAHRLGLPVHVCIPGKEDLKYLDPAWRDYATSWEDGGFTGWTYRQRNEQLVKLCDHLLAFPAWPEGEDNPRSGTWMTIRIARRAGKPVTVRPQAERGS